YAGTWHRYLRVCAWMLCDIVSCGRRQARSIRTDGSSPKTTIVIQPIGVRIGIRSPVVKSAMNQSAAMASLMGVICMMPSVAGGTAVTLFQRAHSGPRTRRRSIVSVVEHEAQQRALDLDAAVVFDESQLAELVHEKIHTRTRRAHHLGKRLLREFRQRSLGLIVAAVPGEQQQGAGQALLARIEQLVDQVL